MNTGVSEKVLFKYKFKENLSKFFSIWNIFIENIFLIMFLIWDFFDPYPYNFLPLSAQIKLEINYSYELEHISIKEVILMAIKETFHIQEINLDKKDNSYYVNAKELEDYWNNECAEHPSNKHCKIFCD